MGRPWKVTLVCAGAFSAWAGQGFSPSMAGELESSVFISKASDSDGDSEGTTARRFSGNVSWYGAQFHGRRTASGETFDMNKLTAAHRTLPFGTRVLVENPKTGQSVVVKVNDRGPFSARRVLDVSREAARRLGILLGGTAFMNCTVVDVSEAGPDSGAAGG